jgi:hypothetical protein
MCTRDLFTLPTPGCNHRHLSRRPDGLVVRIGRVLGLPSVSDSLQELRLCHSAVRLGRVSPLRVHEDSAIPRGVALPYQLHETRERSRCGEVRFTIGAQDQLLLFLCIVMGRMVLAALTPAVSADGISALTGDVIGIC